MHCEATMASAGIDHTTILINLSLRDFRSGIMGFWAGLNK